jgi:DNA-binding transcriptional LysR family regulator
MSEQELRFLSFDDLLILTYLATGVMTVTDIGKTLYLTQPAITRRIRKMEEIFQTKIIQRVSRGVRMTAFGHATAARAREAIAAMTKSSEAVMHHEF